MRAIGGALATAPLGLLAAGGTSALPATVASAATRRTPTPAISASKMADVTVSPSDVLALALSTHALQTNYISTPAVSQQYVLDCEAAALQAALAARGTSVTQDWILSSIGADTRSAVRGASGDILEWGDPYVTFVGDVNGSEVTSTGYGVYFGPIAAAARAAGHAAIGAQGWTATAIYRALSAGYPVVIWTDTSFAAAPTRTWTAWDGRAVRYAIGEHAVTMTGIDVDHRTVQLLDVETGRFRVFTTAQFTEFWLTFGNMAVVVA